MPQLADVSCHPHLDDHQDQDGLHYLDIPDSAKNLAPAMKMRFNEGNGICLCHAVSQQNNFDPIKLRKYLNTKIIQAYSFLKDYITFPITTFVGSGNRRVMKEFRNPYEYFDFLCSDDSIYSWNTGDMEIVMLASIINQSIHILTYNIQGLPAGTPLNKRARMDSWNPIPDLVESNEFTMDDDVVPPYEGTVHFSLLVRDDGINEDTYLENGHGT